MPNIVQVDFVGNVTPLFTAADQAASRLNNLSAIQTGKPIDQLVNSVRIASPQILNFATTTAASIDKISAPVQRVSSDFLNLEKKALSLQNQLGRQSVAALSSGLPILSQQAADASGEAARLQTTLRRLSVDAGRTTNQTVLDQINQEANLAKGQLREVERLLTGIKQVNTRAAVAPLSSVSTLTGEQKYARINLARQGADVFTQAGSGASAGLIAIQQGPQIIEAAAQAGLSVSAAAATSVTALAAGLLVIRRITGDIRDAEAQKLSLIETAVSARNKEIISQREAVALTAQALANAERQRVFQNTLATEDVGALERQVDLRRKFLELNPKSDTARAELLALEERRDAAKNQRLDRNSAAFSVSGESQIANQRQAADFEARTARARNEDIKTAQERVTALGETASSVFLKLRGQVNTDNPLVQFSLDASSAITDLRKNLAGLPTDLVKTAVQMQQALNERNLFNARVSSAFDASNLRQQAREFRSGFKGESDNDFEKRINDGLQRAGFNLNDFNGFSTAQRASFLAQRQSVDFAVASASGRFNGVDLNTLTRGTLANARQRASSEETVQERLDRQLKVLDSVSPKDRLQRVDADSRILALTANVDPTTLRQDTRNRLADVIERRATETERREIDSLREQQTQSKILEQIRGEISNLRGIAQKGGTAAIEVLVKNESDNATVDKKPKAATQEDVRSRYDPDNIFEFIGGTNR